MIIENQDTFEVCLRKGVNLFTGAGFSVLAQDDTGKSLPLGPELATELAATFSVPAADLSLAQIHTVIDHSRRAELREYLTKRFTVAKFDPRYLILMKFRIDTAFTTNIDDLLYMVYADCETAYLNDIDTSGPAFADQRAIDLVALHGCVRSSDRPFTFNPTDLASAFGADPDRWHYLTQRLQKAPTLFWGYSLGDAGTLEALNPDTTRGRHHKDKWIVLHPKAADDGTQQYFRALGFQLIIADTPEMLDYLGGVDTASSALPAPGATVATPSLFPQEAIPRLTQVPVRPVLEFYLGAPPQWCDIFQGGLHRTAHFDRVRNSVNARKHTLVIGLPASGKTTILMQLAADTQFDGHKLFYDSLIPDKARLVCTRLRGARALVFVDNFADSLGGFEILAGVPNVQLIGADRDYNFALVSHRIATSRFAIHNVTDLSPSDIQACLQSIPVSIRSDGYRQPEVGEGIRPSLFEIIEANLTRPTLSQRFGSVLTQLAREDPNLRDLLLMISYVHKCRTPASMDMLIAFMRDVTTDYKEIYSMRAKLGGMISDYVGDLVDGYQDHFVSRSTLVASAVLENAPGPAIRQMMLTFHKNVSPYRICRYDVFKRQAYDADLMIRAFTQWEEGSEFYQTLYSRDRSPYLLQQGALYLSRKGRHIEAFEMIDAAITASGGRVWSIRNSHAIILFKANIGHYEDPTARRMLRKSMDILSTCYRSDKRKPFHALTLADQATKYWDAYGDDDAREYLQQALAWLQEEAERAPWNDGVRRLVPLVERRLR